MGLRERKKEEMRQRILAVAMTLFDREGFDDVTMEGIAKEADVAKATLYSYFPVKEALLVEWVQQLSADMEDSVEALLQQHRGVRSRITALFALLQGLLEANRTLVERYIVYRLSSKERFCGDQTLRSGIAGIIREILAQGQANAELGHALSPEELTAYLESLFLTTLMMAWFVDGEKVDLGQRFEGMLSLFFEGAGGNHEH